jgi:hypothetical protein
MYHQNKKTFKFSTIAKGTPSRVSHETQGVKRLDERAGVKT